MKQFHFFSGALVILLLLYACKKHHPEDSPNCPDCWDSQMVCVENTCQCPEGYAETWLNLYNNAEKDEVPPSGRKFCIKPDKLTFMAYFPKFECIDSFAFRFHTEHLEVNDQTPIQDISSVNLLKPQKALPPGLILDTKDPNGLWVGITGLHPTLGGDRKRSKNKTRCKANPAFGKNKQCRPCFQTMSSMF